MTIEIYMHGNPMVIASTYIPHDQTPGIPRQHAWDLLDETRTRTPIAKNLILFGDMNTSLHARKEGEEDYIGEHVFGKGMPFVTLKETYIPAWKTDNREMLANLISEHMTLLSNIFFNKYKATYRRISMHIGPLWTPDRYEEIDHCIVRNSCENTITNVQTEPNTNVNTDHYTMVATIRQRLKANDKTELGINLKSIDIGPDTDEKGSPNPLIVQFNGKVQEILANSETSKDVGNFTDAVKKAAIETLNIKPSKGKKQDCDPEMATPSLNKDYKQSHNTKTMKQS